MRCWKQMGERMEWKGKRNGEMDGLEAASWTGWRLAGKQEATWQCRSPDEGASTWDNGGYAAARLAHAAHPCLRLGSVRRALGSACRKYSDYRMRCRSNSHVIQFCSFARHRLSQPPRTRHHAIHLLIHTCIFITLETGNLDTCRSWTEKSPDFSLCISLRP